MSLRRTPLANEECYHIFNRGVEKRPIFMGANDFSRFFQSMIEFNVIDPIGSIYENSFLQKKKLGGEASKSASKSKRNKKLVEFVCFCLNPNHYHFILKQVSNRGIEKFMHRLATGYTGYFNKKKKRTGVLFQGPFKSVHIETNGQLLHTSAYVNLNYKVHRLGGFASKFLSSWDEYMGKSKYNFCDKKIILDQFRNKVEYKKYAEMTLKSIQQRKEILRELEE